LAQGIGPEGICGQGSGTKHRSNHERAKKNAKTGFIGRETKRLPIYPVCRKFTKVLPDVDAENALS